MKNQTEKHPKITDAIRRAALTEAEAWHDLCKMTHVYHGDVDAWRELEKEWEVAREHLADAMRLRGADRYRPRLIYRALCTLNGVPEFENERDQ